MPFVRQKSLKRQQIWFLSDLLTKKLKGVVSKWKRWLDKFIHLSQNRTLGKRLENTLENSWETPWELLGIFWKSLENPLENSWKTFWRTPGKLLENYRKTLGIVLENSWKTSEVLQKLKLETIGKLLEHSWRTPVFHYQWAPCIINKYLHPQKLALKHFWLSSLPHPSSIAHALGCRSQCFECMLVFGLLQQRTEIE